MEDHIISKKSEVENIIKELRSHYYQEKFFVDPDKNFLPLLERIIVNLTLKNKEIL